MRCTSLDDMLPPEDSARVVWAYVAGLDLTPLLQNIKAVSGRVGRDANDPRVLLALWLFATTQGVGSARELDRLCGKHLSYQGLCGGMSVNYHSLSDFRKDHVAFLDQLLTDGVATLLHEGLVQLQRVAQDGMRVRATARGVVVSPRGVVARVSGPRPRPKSKHYKNSGGQRQDSRHDFGEAEAGPANERLRERQERVEKAIAERPASCWSGERRRNKNAPKGRS